MRSWWRRGIARAALREGRTWALVGLILLGGVLAYVAWVAAQVFALQESEGVTTGVALARLGMDSAGWLVQRTALSVFLVCLAGWTRYHPPAKDVAAEVEAERARLEADLMLEPLRARLRAQQVRGARGTWDALRGRESAAMGDRGDVSEMGKMGEVTRAGSGARGEAERETTGAASAFERPLGTPSAGAEGPGSPARRRRARGGGLNPDGDDGIEGNDGKVVEMPRRRRRRNGSGGAARGSVEPLARRRFTSGMSAGELGRLAGISKGAASKWRRVLQTEADAASGINAEAAR